MFRPLVASYLVLSFFSVTALGQEQPNKGLEILREKVNVQLDVEYAKAGEVSLKLDLYQPKEKSEKPRPCVVWIHGGGWRGGNKTGGAGRVASYVTSGDYVGASVGYRLTDVAIWPAQIHDCKAAIRYLRANAEKLGIDPNKIGVWGSSAGGHLVSLLGTSGDVKEVEGDLGTTGVSSRVACVVNFCGPTDFLAFAADNPSLSNSGGPVYQLFGGSPKEKGDFARQASPVTHVTKDDVPFLHMHGTADRTVPVNQAELLNEALKKAGCDSTFVKIEEGAHGFGGPQVDARVKAFFDKHLLGKQVEVSGEAIKAPAQPK